MKDKSKNSIGSRLNDNRNIIQILVLAAAVALLIPPITTLLNNSQVLSHLNLLWLVAAFAAAIAASFFAALVYLALSPKPIKLWPTFLAQIATSFTNRLLPGGLGGLGLNAFYLSKAAGISKTEAATIAGANNLVGFLGFAIVLAILGAGSSTTMTSRPSTHFYIITALATAIIVFGFVLLLNLAPGFKKHFYKSLGQIKATLLNLAHRPKRLALALLASIAITACYVGAFWLAVTSAGGYITPLGAMLVFAAGNAAIAASPTPGGIGTTELAMTAALRANSVESSLALAVVLSFRLAAYWLPIIPGYIAFRYLTAKKLL